MAKHEVYTITVTNFFKHNPKSRKSFTHFMVAKNYFHDAKIVQLTPNESQLFLYCCAIACDMVSNQFQITAQSLPKQFRISSQSLANHLERLQCFQLLSYSKNEPLINRIEENRREEKGIEIRAPLSGARLLENSEVIKKPKSKPSAQNLEDARKVRNAYKLEYYNRYKIDVVESAKFHSAIKQIIARIGVEDALGTLQFFVWHNDPLYLKGTHQIGLALRDCESLRTQYIKGKAITFKDLKTFETAETLNKLTEDLKNGGF